MTVRATSLARQPAEFELAYVLIRCPAANAPEDFVLACYPPSGALALTVPPGQAVQPEDCCWRPQRRAWRR
jgi:hypothetical protein